MFTVSSRSNATAVNGQKYPISSNRITAEFYGIFYKELPQLSHSHIVNKYQTNMHKFKCQKIKSPLPEQDQKASYIEIAQFISIQMFLWDRKYPQVFRKTIYVKLNTYTFDFEYLRVDRSVTVCFGSSSWRKRPIATGVVFLILQRA